MFENSLIVHWSYTGHLLC